MSGSVVDMTRARLARLTERKRAAILADLGHPILGVGSDAEIAEEHRVSPAVVRELRAEWRRDLRFAAIVRRARELAGLIEWERPLGELVEGCIADAIRRYGAGVCRD